MGIRAPILCLFACLCPAWSATDSKAEIAQLKAEVASLKKQLAAAGGSCEISVSGAVSKAGIIASDVVQHLLGKTDLDEKVVGVVSDQLEVARTMSSKVVDQVTAHPCGSADYQKCVAHVTASPVYQAHVAPHVKTLTAAAEPHMDKINPAIDSATKAYKSATEVVQTQVVPTLKQITAMAREGMSSVLAKIHVLIDPVFVMFGAASPQHHQVMPQDPLDRVLLVCTLLYLVFHFFFLVPLLFWLAVALGLKLPLKVTKKSLSWGFWFGTGFYVCGLCRKRKASNKSADAKAEPKKNTASKPATLNELVEMLEKTKAKGKLTDGATRLADAAKNGKPLQGPEEMKGKVVSKDVLKKALAKFKEVDMKKLGL
jgi:hypothetical protein